MTSDWVTYRYPTSPALECMPALPAQANAISAALAKHVAAPIESEKTVRYRVHPGYTRCYRGTTRCDFKQVLFIRRRVKYTGLNHWGYTVAVHDSSFHKMYML